MASCPKCDEEVPAAYLQTHLKRRHTEQITSAFSDSRPVPHFSGIVDEDGISAKKTRLKVFRGMSRKAIVAAQAYEKRSNELSECPICHWRMAEGKVRSHMSYRHNTKAQDASREKSL